MDGEFSLIEIDANQLMSRIQYAFARVNDPGMGKS
jgi:hypothetical protein